MDNAAAARFAQQMHEALKPVMAQYAQAARQMHAALQPLMRQFNESPDLVARLALRDEDDADACHCLCGMHRDQAEGVCQGEAEPGVAFTFRSPTVGTQRVPMCLPCHAAHVERLADPLATSPDAMRVTFTSRRRPA
jgi:hypothetical protein